MTFLTPFVDFLTYAPLNYEFDLNLLEKIQLLNDVSVISPLCLSDLELNESLANKLHDNLQIANILSYERINNFTQLKLLDLELKNKLPNSRSNWMDDSIITAILLEKEITHNMYFMENIYQLVFSQNQIFTELININHQYIKNVQTIEELNIYFANLSPIANLFVNLYSDYYFPIIDKLMDKVFLFKKLSLEIKQMELQQIELLAKVKNLPYIHQDLYFYIDNLKNIKNALKIYTIDVGESLLLEKEAFDMPIPRGFSCNIPANAFSYKNLIYVNYQADFVYQNNKYIPNPKQSLEYFGDSSINAKFSREIFNTKTCIDKILQRISRDEEYLKLSKYFNSIGKHLNLDPRSFKEEAEQFNIYKDPVKYTKDARTKLTLMDNFLRKHLDQKVLNMAWENVKNIHKKVK